MPVNDEYTDIACIHVVYTSRIRIEYFSNWICQLRTATSSHLIEMDVRGRFQTSKGQQNSFPRICSIISATVASAYLGNYRGGKIRAFGSSSRRTRGLLPPSSLLVLSSRQIRRCDFAIDSTRTIDTALAPPPSRPLFQGSPSANALAARELLVTSPTYRYARARTAHARRTHARGSGAGLHGERKVRPRENVHGVLLPPLPSSPGFRGPGLIFCLVLLVSVLFQRPLRTS